MTIFNNFRFLNISKENLFGENKIHYKLVQGLSEFLIRKKTENVDEISIFNIIFCNIYINRFVVHMHFCISNLIFKQCKTFLCFLLVISSCGIAIKRSISILIWRERHFVLVYLNLAALLTIRSSIKPNHKSQKII